MTIEEIPGALGQGGFAAALIVVFWRVGNAIVEVLKGLRTDLNEHTKADLEHHGKVRETLVALDSKIDTLIDQQDRPARRAPTEPGSQTGLLRLRSRRED